MTNSIRLWDLLFMCAVLGAAIAGYAAHVVLSHVDAGRRADAYKVLKLIWGTIAVVSGAVVGAIIRLDNLNLLA